MKFLNSTFDRRDGSSNSKAYGSFCKMYIFGPILVAKLEASSNVLAAGCAEDVATSTTVLGRRVFVLKLPKPYS
jgi:hypothetical protein